MGTDGALRTESNCRFEVLGVAEVSNHALDFVNLAIESLTHRIDHRML